MALLVLSVLHLAGEDIGGRALLAQETPRADTVVAAAIEDWAPHYLLTHDGQPTGFATDVMSAVARRVGLAVRFVPFRTFAEATEALAAGTVDVIPDFGITEARASVDAFTRPFEAFRVSVFVRRSDGGVRSMGDLTGRTVAVVESNAAIDLLRQAAPGARQVVFNDPRGALFALLAAHVDAVAYPDEVLVSLARSARVEDRIRRLAVPLGEIRRGMAVRRTDMALRTTLEKGLDSLLASEEYGEIYRRWFGTKPSFWTVPRLLWSGAVLILLTLGFMAVWRYRSVSRLARELRRSIGEREVEAEARRKEEERFRQIAERIRDVFWIRSPGKERMEYVSPAYEDVWGLTPEALYEDASSWLPSVHPEDRDRVAAAIALQSEGGYDLQYRIVRPDGEVRWIRDRAYPIRNDDGEVYRILGVARDVTRETELQQRLQRSERLEAVGRLAGGIAHDFNNLLTVIRSQIELTLMDVDAGTALADDIKLIQSAARKASVLTSQLLAFSRDQVLRPQVLELRPTVEGMAQMLDRILGDELHVALDLAEDLPPVKVDPGQLERVILNLAANARDAMPQGGGTLTLRAYAERFDEIGSVPEDLEPGLFTVLEASDTGVGMDEDTRRQIFDPFFTTKPKGVGTGLGLAMAYGFMRQTGGCITVRSEPGRGATFRLYFPAAEGETVAGEILPPAHAAVGSASGTVLVIEDDDDVRRVATRILDRVGFRVTAVDSGEAGIEALERGETPDVILTDLILGGIGGRWIVDHVRDRDLGIPVVVMSGYDDDSPGHPGDLPPEVPFLQKPFTAEELVAVIRSASGGA